MITITEKPEQTKLGKLIEDIHRERASRGEKQCSMQAQAIKRVDGGSSRISKVYEHSTPRFNAVKSVSGLPRDAYFQTFVEKTFVLDDMGAVLGSSNERILYAFLFWGVDPEPVCMAAYDSRIFWNTEVACRNEYPSFVQRDADECFTSDQVFEATRRAAAWAQKQYGSNLSKPELSRYWIEKGFYDIQPSKLSGAGRRQALEWTWKGRPDIRAHATIHGENVSLNDGALDRCERGTQGYLPSAKRRGAVELAIATEFAKIETRFYETLDADFRTRAELFDRLYEDIDAALTGVPREVRKPSKQLHEVFAA